MKRLLLALALAGVTLLGVTPVLAQPSPLPAAIVSKAAMNRDERAILPDATGKVTKRGLVAGTIVAEVGDFVLPPNAIQPDDEGGEVPGSQIVNASMAAAASTVLHASNLWVVSAGTTSTGVPARLRILHAYEENTANEARAYYRQRLVYGTTTDYDWDTYHEQGLFRVHFVDVSATAGDGCGDFTNSSGTYVWEHCTWQKDPDGIRASEGDAPQATYVVAGTYRAKGNGDDQWMLNIYDIRVWQPATDSWKLYANCGDGHWNTLTGWRVGDNAKTTASSICPIPIGSNP